MSKIIYYPDGKPNQELNEEGIAIKTYIYDRDGDVLQVLDKDGNPDTEMFRRFGHLKGKKSQDCLPDFKRLLYLICEADFPCVP